MLPGIVIDIVRQREAEVRARVDRRVKQLAARPSASLQAACRRAPGLRGLLGRCAAA